MCSAHLKTRYRKTKSESNAHAFKEDEEDQNEKHNDQTFNEYKKMRAREEKKLTENATQRTEKIASTITRTIVFVLFVLSIHSTLGSVFSSSLFALQCFDFVFVLFFCSLFFSFVLLLCTIFNTHSRANVYSMYVYVCLLTIIAAVAFHLLSFCLKFAIAFVCTSQCFAAGVYLLELRRIVHDGLTEKKLVDRLKKREKKVEEQQNETN